MSTLANIAAGVAQKYKLRMVGDVKQDEEIFFFLIPALHFARNFSLTSKRNNDTKYKSKSNFK